MSGNVNVNRRITWVQKNMSRATSCISLESCDQQLSFDALNINKNSVYVKCDCCLHSLFWHEIASRFETLS